MQIFLLEGYFYIYFYDQLSSKQQPSNLC